MVPVGSGSPKQAESGGPNSGRRRRRPNRPPTTGSIQFATNANQVLLAKRSLRRWLLSAGCIEALDQWQPQEYPSSVQEMGIGVLSLPE